MLLDVGAGSVHVEFVRVPYDVDAAAHGVRASGLPHDFARFLEVGGLPRS